ncbi:MAG TPA: small-conductance mechanosensitive ion channel [Thermoanaerobaculia bacterium]|nr:small-conductance mechanosensitive ion channel [Thermoanaerobaculia bacterium]
MRGTVIECKISISKKIAKGERLMQEEQAPVAPMDTAAPAVDTVDPGAPAAAAAAPVDPAASATADFSSWWDAFVVSISEIMTMLMRGFLKFVGFLLIILIGWIISSWIARAVAAILRRVKFNEFSERVGLTDTTRRMGATRDPAGIVAEVVKWLIRIVVLVIAFSALGLPALSAVLYQFLAWLPQLVIAMAVLLIGALAANLLGDVVRGITADAGFRNPNTLANITSIAIWAFAVVIAVNQVGIGEALVNTLLIAVVGAVALAAGLAFGLGGRELAGRLLDEWYRESRQARSGTRERTEGSAPRSVPPGSNIP